MLKTEPVAIRLPELLRLADTMSAAEWLQLLGLHWSNFEHVSAFAWKLRNCCHLRGTGPFIEMMTPQERRVLDTAPDAISIFRGSGQRNAHGLCWTTSRAAARRYAIGSKHRMKKPVVVRGRLKKHNIAAVKRVGNDIEVFALRGVCVTAVRPLHLSKEVVEDEPELPLRDMISESDFEKLRHLYYEALAIPVSERVT